MIATPIPNITCPMSSSAFEYSSDVPFDEYYESDIDGEGFGEDLANGTASSPISVDREGTPRPIGWVLYFDQALTIELNHFDTE